MVDKSLWNELLSDEFNQEVDSWADARNALRGQVAYPEQVGNTRNPWSGPSKRGPNSHYAMFNEWVTTDLIRHFCDGVGDKNPLYRWEDYARFTRYGRVVAPNGILICMGEAGAGQGTVAPGFGRSLAGGSTWTWFKSVYPGDRFHVFGTDMGVNEKKPRRAVPYRLFQAMYRTTYLNQRNEIVATRDRTRMQIVAESRQKTEAAFTERPRHRYTPQELDAIHQAYRDEETRRRGADTRFWEDVHVGDEIFPVVAGPLTTLDVHVWMAAMGQQSALNINWDMLDGHVDDHGWVDPETNAPRWRAEAHLVDAAARVTGLRSGAYGHHGQFEALMQKALQNWMGDDGFLKYQSNRTRRPSWMGDTTTVTGTVTRTYVEDGQHLVDLAVECTTQNDEVHQTCDATVILPSRTQFIYPGV
ncbi:MAG: MaoC family dehydratase [Microbacterium sp.]|uniref:FAS1-like dehydratase domain-containing protein n=1 Tax=Microbacterium sp. TaxID=51671 RepID=UPI0039E6CA04